MTALPDELVLPEVLPLVEPLVLPEVLPLVEPLVLPEVLPLVEPLVLPELPLVEPLVLPLPLVEPLVLPLPELPLLLPLLESPLLHPAREPMTQTASGIARARRANRETKGLRGFWWIDQALNMGIFASERPLVGTVRWCRRALCTGRARRRGVQCR